MLRQVERSVPARDAVQRDRVRAALDSVWALLEEARRMAYDLVPAIVEDLGLGAAIDRLLRTFSDLAGNSTKREVIALDGQFSCEAETQICRARQEIFNNIHRHAAARRVGLVIRRLDRRIQFDVRGDGLGFKADRISSGASWGAGQQRLCGFRHRRCCWAAR